MVLKLAKLAVDPCARMLPKSSVDLPFGEPKGPRSGRSSFFDHFAFVLSDLLGVSSGRSTPVGWGERGMTHSPPSWDGVDEGKAVELGVTVAVLASVGVEPVMEASSGLKRREPAGGDLSLAS